MNAIKPGRKAEVGTIIHDQPHGAITMPVPHFCLPLGDVGVLTLAQDSAQFPSLLQHDPSVA